MPVYANTDIANSTSNWTRGKGESFHKGTVHKFFDTLDENASDQDERASLTDDEDEREKTNTQESDLGHGSEAGTDVSQSSVICGQRENKWGSSNISLSATKTSSKSGSFRESDCPVTRDDQEAASQGMSSGRFEQFADGETFGQEKESGVRFTIPQLRLKANNSSGGDIRDGGGQGNIADLDIDTPKYYSAKAKRGKDSPVVTARIPLKVRTVCSGNQNKGGTYADSSGRSENKAHGSSSVLLISPSSSSSMSSLPGKSSEEDEDPNRTPEKGSNAHGSISNSTEATPPMSPEKPKQAKNPRNKNSDWDDGTYVPISSLRTVKEEDEPEGQRGYISLNHDFGEEPENELYWPDSWVNEFDPEWGQEELQFNLKPKEYITKQLPNGRSSDSGNGCDGKKDDRCGGTTYSPKNKNNNHGTKTTITNTTNNNNNTTSGEFDQQNKDSSDDDHETKRARSKMWNEEHNELVNVKLSEPTAQRYSEKYPKDLKFGANTGQMTSKFQEACLSYIKEVTETSTGTEGGFTGVQHPSSSADTNQGYSFHMCPTMSISEFGQTHGEDESPSSPVENKGIAPSASNDGERYYMNDAEYGGTSSSTGRCFISFASDSHTKSRLDIGSTLCPEITNRCESPVESEDQKLDETILCMVHGLRCEGYCTTCQIPVCNSCNEPSNHVVIPLKRFIADSMNGGAYRVMRTEFETSGQSTESIVKKLISDIQLNIEFLQTSIANDKLEFNELEYRYKLNHNSSVYESDIEYINKCISLMDNIPKLTTKNNEKVLEELLYKLASYIPSIQTSVGKSLISRAGRIIGEAFNLDNSITDISNIIEQIKNIIAVNKPKIKEEMSKVSKEQRKLVSHLVLFPKILKSNMYYIFYLNHLLSSGERMPSPFAYCYLRSQLSSYIPYQLSVPNCRDPKLYEAFDGARNLTFVQETVYSKMRSCGGDLLVSEPIDICLDVIDSVEINCRVSPMGVLGQSITNENHIVVFTNLFTRKSVYVDVPKCTIAFHDDKVFLLPCGKSFIFKASVESVFLNPSCKTFTVIQLTHKITSVDSSSTPSTGKVFIRFSDNSLCQFDAITHSSTIIGKCSGPMMYTAGIKYKNALAVYSLQSSSGCVLTGCGQHSDFEIADSEYEGNVLLYLGQVESCGSAPHSPASKSHKSFGNKTAATTTTNQKAREDERHKQECDTSDFGEQTGHSEGNLEGVVSINSLGDITFNGESVKIQGVAFWQGQSITRLYRNIFIFINKITHSWQCIKISGEKQGAEIM